MLQGGLYLYLYTDGKPLTNNQNPTLGFPSISQTNTAGSDIVSSRRFIAELKSVTVSGVLPAAYFAKL
jgi:hypothetical protein